MTTEAEITDLTKYDSGLAPEKHNAIAQQFNQFHEQITGLLDTAKAIEVKTAKDTAAMKLARTTRLGLKNARVEVEATRKKLKEASLLEGKAIDGMANIIKHLIVPVERDLQEKEDFVKHLEEQRIQALTEERRAELEALDMDCAHFDLGHMETEAYTNLLGTAQAGYEAKKKAEEEERARQEEERVAREKEAEEQRKREAEERKQREAELAEERKARAEAEAKAKAEAEARAKAEAEAKRIRDEEAKRRLEEERAKAAEERRRKDEELARVKAEKEAEQKRLAAPDKEKLRQLDEMICAIHIPAVKNEVAIATLTKVRTSLNRAVKDLRIAIEQL